MIAPLFETKSGLWLHQNLKPPDDRPFLYLCLRGQGSQPPSGQNAQDQKRVDYLAIIILACVFISFERIVPLREKQLHLRRHWANDIVHLLLNGFFVRAGSTVVFGAIMAVYTFYVDPSHTAWVAQQPIWLQIPAIMLISDIGYYISHRIAHAVPFLWKFHAVHHSSEEMDWLASHRLHPVDQIFSNLLSLLPIYFIGFSPTAMAIHIIIYQANSFFVHSNIRLNFGPLKYIFASPEYHHWHHANQPEAYDRNFAAQLAIIDVIAGTIFMPKHMPEKYGLNEEMPTLYPQQMLHPFRAIFKSWTNRKSTKGIHHEQET